MSISYQHFIIMENFEIPNKCPCDIRGPVPDRVRMLFNQGAINYDPNFPASGFGFRQAVYACDYHNERGGGCSFPEARFVIQEASRLAGIQPYYDSTVGKPRSLILRS